MSERRPLGPRRFDFDVLGDDDFELLTYLVVLLEHPDALRLRAPDFGADAALRREDGSYGRCWQSKRFTKQVSWPKCKASLDTAVKTYAMPRYTFCFARDLTGPQEQLFKKHLVGRHRGVDVDWLGNSRLTGYLLGSDQGRRIEAHFYGDPVLDTQALMHALRAGGELLTGSDAVARMNEIADWFESRDPFFSYTLSTRTPSVAPAAAATPGMAMAVEIQASEDRIVRIEAVPRNRAAFYRMPQGELQFPATPEGQIEQQRFRETLLRGGEATFSVGVRFESLPAGLVAFDPGGQVMDVSIRAERTPPLPLDARIIVTTDRGKAAIDIALLPVEPSAKWDAMFEGALEGLTMTLLLRVRKGRGQTRMNWTYRPTAGRVSQQANLLALLDVMYGSGTLRIQELGGDRHYEQKLRRREPDNLIPFARRLLEDLRTIQDWVGEPFELSDDWLAADLDGVADAAQMIRTGEKSAVPKYTLRVPPEKLEEIGEGPHAIWTSQGFLIRVLGVERLVGFLSGGFEGRVTRSEPVIDDGQELVEIDIEPVEASVPVIFKFTRDKQNESA